MRNFLESRTGKEIDLNCGSLSITGKVTRVESEVVHIEKDGVTCYINIEKIIAVWDLQEKKPQKPGFTADAK